ncbi:MAG: nucleotidyltransferase domain-containing protein [Planctomycetia bacterium]
MKTSITRSRPGSRAVGRPGASGTFVLRLDPQLHGCLRREAEAAGTSLNDWCSRMLAAPGGHGIDEAGRVVLPIRSRLGSDLIGVIVHGSFARGELTAGSDVDLLVVIDTRLTITRSLYREWEGAVPSWGDREVDVHFVHLPEPGAAVSGMWAEAAVCGIVLHDHDLIVSRRLAEIRGRIAGGEVVRRMAQGQPYWVHEKHDAKS